MATAPKLPRRLNFSGERGQPGLAARVTEFQDDVIEYLRVLDLPNALRDLEEQIADGGGGGSGGGFSDEAAQEAVGNILADTPTIDLTYDTVTPEITAEVKDDSVTNAKLANVATATFKGRSSGGTGSPEDLTATQATLLLNEFEGDFGLAGTKGLVPAPAAGDAASGKYLRADGSWATPAAMLVWQPDAPPISPHAKDDEFVGSALDAKWSEWDPGSVMTATLSTARQMLSLVTVGVTTNSYAGIYQAVPASEFAVYTKVHILCTQVNTMNAGILIATDIAGAGATADFAVNTRSVNVSGELTSAAHFTAYNSTGTQAATVVDTSPVYLRTRVNGTNLQGDWSPDGVQWLRYSNITLSGTPLYVGLAINAANTDTLRTLFEFFRVFSGSGTSGIDATFIGRRG